MGTNFYWHDTPCECCGREDVVHVGKRSAGWSFGFHGMRHDPDEGHYSQMGFAVVSRADWAKVFERDGYLVDEYGQRVEDHRAWVAALVAPDADQRAKEDSPEWRGPYHAMMRDYEWRDIEGFRFTDTEFS